LRGSHTVSDLEGSFDFLERWPCLVLCFDVPNFGLNSIEVPAAFSLHSARGFISPLSFVVNSAVKRSQGFINLV